MAHRHDGVSDPAFLTQEFVISSQFKKGTDLSKWNPRPATFRRPRWRRKCEDGSEDVLCALVALNLTISAQAPTRAAGDQRRQYVFAPTGQRMPYRVYVPNTWDGKASLPIILMLHGAGANEGRIWIRLMAC